MKADVPFFPVWSRGHFSYKLNFVNAALFFQANYACVKTKTNSLLILCNVIAAPPDDKLRRLMIKKNHINRKRQQKDMWSMVHVDCIRNF